MVVGCSPFRDLSAPWASWVGFPRAINLASATWAAAAAPFNFRSGSFTDRFAVLSGPVQAV